MKTIALTTVLMAALLAPPSYSQSAPYAPQRLDGTWLIFVTPDPGCPCGPFINLGTFRADGTLEGNSVAGATEFTGRGEWARTGDREFSIAFAGLIADEKGNPTLAQRVRGTGQLSDNLSELNGTTRADLFDASGKVIVSFTARFRAIKIKM